MTETWHAASTEIYEKARQQSSGTETSDADAAAGGGGADEGEKPAGDDQSDVVDADFEMVDDEKK